MARNDEKAIIEIILKGQQANASLKEMDNAVRAMRAQLNKLPKDSDAFTEKKKEFVKFNAEVKAIKNEVNGLGNSFKQVGAESGSFFSKFSAGVASVFGGNILTQAASKIKDVFFGAIDNQRAFEKSLKNLSAITGATGADLAFYKQQAIEMSEKVKGGAAAVVEAYKLIGSAKPELLENKDALAEVTKQAILLSQAAGLELPDASTRLTDALNQFNAPASEAAKYVDALAAGAKYGAAEVPEVTDALLKFGVAAKSSNINIYESVAAIELLGEKGLKGAEAGTQLRNVFAKLSAAEILPPDTLAALKAAGVNIGILSDKTVPLQTRLKELSKIQGDAATITKVFGLESKNAGEALISNLDRLEKLTGQVKESGVAFEQAAVNMDTLEQAEIEAKNAWDNMWLSFTSGDFGELIKGFVKKATEGIGTLKNSISSLGTLLTTGGNLKAGSETLMAGQISDVIKKTVSQMTVETRKAVLEQEKIETEAMIKALDNAKFRTKEEVQYKADQIAQKIALIKELEKYETKAGLETVVNDKKVADESFLIAAESKKKIEDLTKKHLDNLKKYSDEYVNSKLSTKDQEEKAIMDKYQGILDVTKKGSDDYTRAIFLREEEVDALNKKYADKEVKTKEELIKKISELGLSQTEKEVNDINKKYETLIEAAERFGIDTTIIKETWAEELRNVYQKNNAAEIDANADKNKKLSDADKKFWDQKIEAAQRYYSDVKQVLDMMMENHRIQDDNELKRIEKGADKEKLEQKKLLDSKVINQREYDKRIAKIEDDKLKRERQLKREAAQREKEYAIFQIVINTAMAVAKALANYDYYSAIAFAALGAIQIGIASSKPLPEYAKGGFNVSGNPEGYVDSPTLFTNSASGQDFIAGEKGSEYIVPNWMVNDPAIGPNIQMLETIRKRGYVEGGYNNSTTKTEPTGSGGNRSAAGNSNSSNSDVAAAINTLNRILENGVYAKIMYDQFQKDMSAIDSAKESAQVKN